MSQLELHPEKTRLMDFGRYEIDVSFALEDVELGIEAGINTVVGGTRRFENAVGEWSWDNDESEESEFLYSPSGEPIALVITRNGFVRGSITY